MQKSQNPDNNVAQLTLAELRQKWAEFWGMTPSVWVGRQMLKKSLAFKMRESRGEGLAAEQQKQLDNLVAQYRRNQNFFNENRSDLKPGVRLVKNYNGAYHSVLVRAGGLSL